MCLASARLYLLMYVSSMAPSFPILSIERMRLNRFHFAKPVLCVGRHVGTNTSAFAYAKRWVFIDNIYMYGYRRSFIFPLSLRTLHFRSYCFQYIHTYTHLQHTLICVCVFDLSPYLQCKGACVLLLSRTRVWLLWFFACLLACWLPVWRLVVVRFGGLTSPTKWAWTL